MKTRIYDGSIVDVDGISFLVSIDRDEFMGPPWKEQDGHGPVSGWERRAKAPGEMVLCKDRGLSRFYGFQEAVKIARREGWNTKPGHWRTRREQAHNAALADFNWLKRWCDDQWQWVIVTVHPLDDFGDILPMSACLGGVAYDPDEARYITEVVEELARAVIFDHQAMFAAPLPKVEQVIDPDDLLTLPDFAARAA